MDLSAFMSPNAIKVENTKYVVSKRFLGADGQPIEWEIKSISEAENEQLRAASLRKVPGKKAVQKVDEELYNGKLLVACTVFPNLNDEALQNSYGVLGADKLLKKMLTSGEYAYYTGHVLSANGFNIDFEELVDEAKN